MNENRPFQLSRIVLGGLAAAWLAFAAAPVALATTDDQAAALCTQEMTANQGAMNLRNIAVRRHDHVPYVYGDADFSDASNVHFRCRVYEDQVRNVRYMVRNPELENGRAWSEVRPQGNEHEGLDLDEPAMMAPPAGVDLPKFELVPQ